MFSKFLIHDPCFNYIDRRSHKCGSKTSNHARSKKKMEIELLHPSKLRFYIKCVNKLSLIKIL